jgi:hypothetical protein
MLACFDELGQLVHKDCVPLKPVALKCGPNLVPLCRDHNEAPHDRCSGTMRDAPVRL